MLESELNTLLQRLLGLSRETEWVEWKVNDFKPDDIGEYLSALSNASALHDQDFGYIVWGIENVSLRIVGTRFRPRQERIGNEELENWLATLLAPRIDFRIHEFTAEGHPVVVFEVPPATHTPVSFKGVEYIRVGSYKKKLKEHPEKERALWATFDRTTFEQGIALSGASSEDVLGLLDYPAFFEMTSQILPDGHTSVLNRLADEQLVLDRGGSFDITNLGAILFARDLNQFRRTGRKVLRVIMYAGTSRVQTIREQAGTKGYALGFEGAVDYISAQLPQNEQIEQALRREVRMYPEIAIRELVANALIHQDFSISGAGPMVEIFSDRIEITNPGRPLIPTDRFIGPPPRSRNETLASLARRLNMCEERGSGIVKAITAIELYQLPAPVFKADMDSTRAILFAHKKLNEMDRDDRVRACYQHACLRVASRTVMTNNSLRKRFAISDNNAAQASRIIRDALDAKLIKEFDPTNKSRRQSRYVPSWA